VRVKCFENCWEKADFDIFQTSPPGNRSQQLLKFFQVTFGNRRVSGNCSSIHTAFAFNTRTVRTYFVLLCCGQELSVHKRTWLVGGYRKNVAEILGLRAAYQQRPHPRGKEGVRLPVAKLCTGTTALQSAVHAGRSHASPYWRKAAQMHCKLLFVAVLRVFQSFLGKRLLCELDVLLHVLKKRVAVVSGSENFMLRCRAVLGNSSLVKLAMLM